MKRGEGDPWKRVRVGGGVAHKDRQRISRGSAIHKKESRDYRERCRLKMEAQIVQWE